MSANESELGSPENRLREAEKQIAIAQEQLDDDDEFQTDLEAAESIIGIVANSLAESRRDA